MSKKTAQEYLKEPYERVLIPEAEGGFSAYISEFEGCHAYGQTADEAFRNLDEVALEWIKSALEQNEEIPPAWNAQEFSGRFALRLPKSLHQELARRAERDGTSLNQYIVAKVAAGTREDAMLERLAQVGQAKTYVVAAMVNVAVTGHIDRIEVPQHVPTHGTITTMAGAVDLFLALPKQLEGSYGRS